jgi:hypothetical protein
MRVRVCACVCVCARVRGLLVGCCVLLLALLCGCAGVCLRLSVCVRAPVCVCVCVRVCLYVCVRLCALRSQIADPRYAMSTRRGEPRLSLSIIIYCFESDVLK